MQELFDLGKGRSANSCRAAGFWGFNLAVPSECCAFCRAVSAVKEGELSTQSPPGGVPRHPLCAGIWDAPCQHSLEMQGLQFSGSCRQDRLYLLPKESIFWRCVIQCMSRTRTGRSQRGNEAPAEALSLQTQQV